MFGSDVERMGIIAVSSAECGRHSIGGPAGVDFPYLLYADQVGKPVDRSDAKAGVGWLRAIADLPTAALDLWDGEIDLRSYWRSLKHTRTESVFCLQDPLPSIAEVLMLPYLVTKKYLVKSGGKAEVHTADDEGGVDLPAA